MRASSPSSCLVGPTCAWPAGTAASDTGSGAYDSGASLGHIYAQLHAHDEHIALADVRATAEVLHDIVTQYLTHR